MSDLVRIFEDYVATNNDEDVEGYLEEHNICSMYDIDRLPALARLLSVEKRFMPIRKELFRRNYLTELPLSETIKALTMRGRTPLYFNPNLVGEEMVEPYRQIVASSEEFHDWLYLKYKSLAHFGKVGGSLAFVMGIPKGVSAKECRRVAFENGFFREMPPKDALHYGEKNRWPYAYFDPETVGEDNARRYLDEFDSLKLKIMFP